eukprot:SAG11_NODE_265_length_11509_cov_26.341455_3_plen_261_part_00
MKFLLLLLLQLTAGTPLTGASSEACDLSGMWHAQRGDSSVYSFVQSGLNFTVTCSGATQSGSDSDVRHWKQCTGSVDRATGRVTLKTDTGNTLHSTPVGNCSRLPWDNDSEWCRVGAPCPGADPRPPPPPGPPPPAPDKSIKHVHVVAMNHLDIGFSCKGCGGSASKRNALDTMPAPYTWKLLDFYLNEAIPAAISTSRALAAAGSNASYVYTTHCWLVSFLLDCPVGFGGLRCPSPAQVCSGEYLASKHKIASTVPIAF